MVGVVKRFHPPDNFLNGTVSHTTHPDTIRGNAVFEREVLLATLRREKVPKCAVSAHKKRIQMLFSEKVSEKYQKKKKQRSKLAFYNLNLNLPSGKTSTKKTGRTNKKIEDHPDGAAHY